MLSRMQRSIVRALAIVAPLLGCAPKPAASEPPPRACTDIGCTNGLHVQLTKATPWPAGAYELAFDIDGTAVTCTGSLPLPACEAGPALACDPAGRVQVGESGCALPPGQHGWADVHIDGEPARVHVTIRQGAAVLHDAEIRPEYRTLQPNGPDCEPTCRSASAAIAVP